MFVGICKALTKKSKKKGCEVIGRWIKACTRHFHWVVTSTKEGQKEVILGKFEAFLSPMTNKHTNLPNKIFDKCAHEDVNTYTSTPRAWLLEGMF